MPSSTESFPLVRLDGVREMHERDNNGQTKNPGLIGRCIFSIYNL